MNEFCFGNVVFDFTELFNVGLECSWWCTAFVGKPSGRALRTEAVMRYRF